MISVIRTDPSNRNFTALVKLLDADLAIRDGDEHAFFAQFNNTGGIPWAVVAYLDNTPIGCGCFKQNAEGVAEVKRMFTHPVARGKGVASLVLASLEKWAAELGFKKCILETGIRQPEAISLYKKAGYNSIPNYGQYAGVESSVCFEKALTPQ
jgi:GNAT superfamily N-acetyltransferase